MSDKVTKTAKTSLRIAKVKFNSNGKLYDYFCSDISINEGDVVFVEGKEEPVFVYEIEEKNIAYWG